MSKADDDPRSLRQVVADSDWKMACAIASSTGTTPEAWFEALQNGVAFPEVQQLAEEIRRKRREAWQERKRRRA